MAWVEQPGYILHRRPYRETSYLLTLLTPENGRVEAVAKGVRGAGRSKQTKQAWLQPFTPLQLRWRDRPQGLVTLASFEAGTVLPLYGDALVCGFYMNELACRLLPEGIGCETLFHHYQTLLQGLTEQPPRAIQAWLLRQFELSLLTSLGAQLHLPDVFTLEQTYRWDETEGIVPALQGISGRCLQALLQGEQRAECTGEQKRFMQQVLKHWLGAKPLKSYQLWKRKG